MFLVLNLTFISAATFDNSQKILETYGAAGYKDLEIKNVLLIQYDVFTSEKKIQVDMAIIPYQVSFDRFMAALQIGDDDYKE